MSVGLSNRPSFLVAGLILPLLVILATAAFAQGAANYSGPPPPDGTVPVTLGQTYSDDALFTHSQGAIPDSVSLSTYVVTGPKTIAIKVDDLFVVGDYYTVWMSSSSAFTSPVEVGTTPQVHTDKDGALVAPAYNSLWDGTGSTPSSATFIVSVPSGTWYFAVQDRIQDAMGSLLDAPCSQTTLQLIEFGCTATGIRVLPDFALSGFTITFSAAPALGVPEFGASPVALVASTLLLFALIGRLRLSRMRRPARS